MVDRMFGLELLKFIICSNQIEGLCLSDKELQEQIKLYELFLDLPKIRLQDVENFVWLCGRAEPRYKVGMNVVVGKHTPPPGGPEIKVKLKSLIKKINAGMNPFWAHVEYETLHPMMDCNGRLGRCLWLWQQIHQHAPYVWGRSFTHQFYYDSLSECRKRK